MKFQYKFKCSRLFYELKCFSFIFDGCIAITACNAKTVSAVIECNMYIDTYMCCMYSSDPQIPGFIIPSFNLYKYQPCMTHGLAPLCSCCYDYDEVSVGNKLAR